MKASVLLGKPSGVEVPATICAHNLEPISEVVDALTVNRLRNPAFAGPADYQTGLAHGWEPKCGNFTGVFFRLVPGEGLAGSEAQMVEVTGGWRRRGLIQSRQWIRKGEKLEISIWARTMHEPVTLHVGYISEKVSAEPYAEQEIQVESAIFRNHRVVLEIPTDDDQAVFFCNVWGNGPVFFHRIETRTAGSGPINGDLIAALQEFQIPALRFPGGLITTAYHWKFGTGDPAYRPSLPDPAFKKSMHYDFGTDEYLTLCHESGIRPHITVNMGAATIPEAAEWAAYCHRWFLDRGHQAPIMYWQLGNEAYGHWSRDHGTPSAYVDVIKEMAPAIRAAYPEALILALGQRCSDGFACDDPKIPWRETVLTGAGTLIDGIVMQNYCIVRHRPDDPVAQHKDVMDQSTWMATVPRDAIADVERHGLNLFVGMSEWNTWIHANHFDPEGFQEPMDIQHGLFAATMLHHFARLAPHFQLANYYHLIQAMGLFRVEKGKVFRSLVADIFSLYRETLPAQRIDLQCESPVFGQTSKMLDALALESNDRIELFLVNCSPDTELDVKLENFGAVLACVSHSGTELSDLTSRTGRVSVGKNIASIPPLTVARLTFSNEARK